MKVIGIGDKEELGFVDPNVMSDAFGVYRAMNGVEESLTLLHSPAGCNIESEYNQILSVNYFSRVVTSALAERDVVFGGEEKLKKAIIKALEVFDASIICVLESVTSRLIGEDVPGIVNRLRGELQTQGCQVPMISVKAAYLEGDHTTGFNKLLETMVEEVMEPPRARKEGSVNLLGLWPDLPNAHADYRELKRLLGRLGIEVNSCLFSRTSLDEIRRAPEARLNLVLSEVLGIPAARRMEEVYSLPYLEVGYPVGSSNTSGMLREVGRFFGLSPDEVERVIEEETDEVNISLRGAIYFIEEVPHLDAAVVADSTHALAFSRFLLEEWAIRPRLISLNTYVPESLEALRKLEEEYDFEAQVLLRPSYHQIRQSLRELKPQLVMGGSWEKITLEQLGLMEQGTSFIPITNYQQVGRLFLYNHPFVGYQGIVHLAEVLINERLKNWVVSQDYWLKAEYFRGY